MKKIISFGSVIASVAMSFFGCGGVTLLKYGDKAPLFTLKNSEGEDVSLEIFRGKVVVLYFYPKDGTPGCTVEACSFRDMSAEFKNNNIEVIGISVDDQESHKKFMTEQALNFTLLADSAKEVSKKYGVLNKMGFSSRTTFIIDKKGAIVKVYDNVSPDGHAEDVLAEAKKIL